MQTAVVRPSPAMFALGTLAAATGGSAIASGRGPVVHALLAGFTVLGFLAVAGQHRVEVGDTVRAITWWSDREVAQSQVDAVRRGDGGRPTRLTTTSGDDDEPVTIPPLVAARRVARALEVPLLTPHGDVVERRAELRAMAWVLGGILLTFALAFALALTA